MGTVFTRTVASGFTAVQYQDAVKSLLTEAWGTPTGRGPNAAVPFGFNFLEWPDFGGRKHFWQHLSAANTVDNIANSATYTGGTAQYQAVAAVRPNIRLTPANTAEARLVAIVGDGYRLYASQVAGSLQVTLVGLLANTPDYWGTKSKVFITGDGTGHALLPGNNPWGTSNADGTAGAVGQPGITQNRPNLSAVNTLVNKRLLSVGHLLNNTQAYVGTLPPDIGYVASTGMSATVFTIADCGADGLYLSFGPSPFVGWSIKVATVPFPGLTVFPAYIYDVSAVGGGAGGECVPVYPSFGQCFPLPTGLKLVSQP